MDITCGRAGSSGSTAVAVKPEMAAGIEAHCRSSSGEMWHDGNGMWRAAGGVAEAARAVELF